MKTYFKTDRNKIKRTTADKWYSKFIRIRDIVYDEIIICPTCGMPFHWKESDCGHYMTRDKPMTRFNEQNCHAQCYSCNRFRGGEQSLHGKFIDYKYGAGTSDKLIALSKIRGQKVHTQLALKDIANEYRLKAKEIAKKRGIEL